MVVGLQVFLPVLTYTSLCLAENKLPFNKLTILLSDFLDNYVFLLSSAS